MLHSLLPPLQEPCTPWGGAVASRQKPDAQDAGPQPEACSRPLPPADAFLAGPPGTSRVPPAACARRAPHVHHALRRPSQLHGPRGGHRMTALAPKVWARAAPISACVVCATSEHLVQHHVFGRRIARHAVASMCRHCEGAVHRRWAPRPGTESIVRQYQGLLPRALLDDARFAQRSPLPHQVTGTSRPRRRPVRETPPRPSRVRAVGPRFWSEADASAYVATRMAALFRGERVALT